MRQLVCCAMVMIASASGWPIVDAAETDGLVETVEGRTISIKPEFHFVPEIGDKLEIVIEIPNVGKATVGSAVVNRIEDERVFAQIAKSTGQIQAGQMVRLLEAKEPDPPVPTEPPLPPSRETVLVVEKSGTKVMSGENVVSNVDKGQRLLFTKRNGDWYLVEFAQGGRLIKGWVHAGNVRVEIASSLPPDDASTIQGWGRMIDVEGGAKAVRKGDVVEFRVPGSYRDLWPPGRVNAPRLVQSVQGDFTAQVKITSPIKVDGLKVAPDAPPEARYPFRSAMLIIWHDEKNFVRFERATTVTKQMWSYHTFDDGTRSLLKFGLVRPEEASYLQIQRKNGTFYAWYRQESDREWTAMELHRLGLPDQVQVGVAVINTTAEPFTVRFEDFTLE